MEQQPSVNDYSKYGLWMNFYVQAPCMNRLFTKLLFCRQLPGAKLKWEIYSHEIVLHPSHMIYQKEPQIRHNTARQVHNFGDCMIILEIFSHMSNRPALTAVWSKAWPLTASCLSPLSRFESQSGHVRKLPLTWGSKYTHVGVHGSLGLRCNTTHICMCGIGKVNQ